MLVEPVLDSNNLGEFLLVSVKGKPQLRLCSGFYKKGGCGTTENDSKMAERPTGQGLAYPETALFKARPRFCISSPIPRTVAHPSKAKTAKSNAERNNVFFFILPPGRWGDQRRGHDGFLLFRQTKRVNPGFAA
jgi:hypothetical protein